MPVATTPGAMGTTAGMDTTADTRITIILRSDITTQSLEVPPWARPTRAAAYGAASDAAYNPYLYPYYNPYSNPYYYPPLY